MLTVDWPTYVVNVPQSYLTALGGVDYRLDIIQVWDDLRELEATDDGRSRSFTCTSVPPRVQDGVPLPRELTILVPYTFSFEDTGTPYRVLFDGANNNIQSRTNLIANVSTASANSPGLVEVANPDLAQALAAIAAIATRIDADQELLVGGTWNALEAGTAIVLSSKMFVQDCDEGTMSLKETP